MDRDDGEDMMIKKAMELFNPKDVNLEILALIAKELHPGRRDTRYKAPFTIPHKDVITEGEVESEEEEEESEEK